MSFLVTVLRGSKEDWLTNSISRVIKESGQEELIDSYSAFRKELQYQFIVKCIGVDIKSNGI